MTTEGRIRLFDVNALVALAVDGHAFHRAAHVARAASPAGWATCPVTESALIRLLLNPTVAGTDVTAAEAIAFLTGLRADTAWRFLPDPTTPTAPTINWGVMVGHKQVTDFHLVDLAARNGAVLATFDAHLVASLDPADRRHVDILSLT